MWNRAVQAHKLTLEAFGRVLITEFKNWLQGEGKLPLDDKLPDVEVIARSFEEKDCEKVQVEKMPGVERDFEDFIASKSNSPTFLFWKQYIDMVGVLLQFIRAECDGIWDLHLSAFRTMLHGMAVYHHVNYLRWGLVYYIEMSELENTANEVFQEFKDGNFVVKETSSRFNQIPTDQALEHVNKLCKLSGGLVGITCNQSALVRWLLTCCERASCVDDIRSRTIKESNLPHKEMAPSRMKKDEDEIKRLVAKLKVLNPFGRDNADLQVISTNDVAPTEVKDDLLSAEKKDNK